MDAAIPPGMAVRPDPIVGAEPRASMRTRLPILLLLLVLAGPARAWTYGDTLTVVWKPLPTLPAIVRPGDTLAVWANAPSSATGWSASLRFGALTAPLAPSRGRLCAFHRRLELGACQPTPPPDGASRKNWWRYFGWPYLGAPPPGEHHSQDYSFDYGLLHAIGMEAYINSGSYDHYLQPTWGAQSMTTEQMGWLAFDVAAVPSGHTKIAFFHYDFGGTLANGLPAPNFSQFSNPAALGLDGVLFG